jgi:hypothetical protein
LNINQPAVIVVVRNESVENDSTEMDGTLWIILPLGLFSVGVDEVFPNPVKNCANACSAGAIIDEIGSISFKKSDQNISDIFQKVTV